MTRALPLLLLSACGACPPPPPQEPLVQPNLEAITTAVDAWCMRQEAALASQVLDPARRELSAMHLSGYCDLLFELLHSGLDTHTCEEHEPCW